MTPISKMHSDYEKLINHALRLIAKKRYTVIEIKQRLGRFLQRQGLESCELEGREDGSCEGGGCEGGGCELIESVINRLLELKYLDDKQYSIDYCSDRIKFKPRGKFLLKRELKLKGIDEELIEEAINTAEIDEFEIAKAAFDRKLGQWAKYDKNKVKEKAFRFLASRGFNPDTIYKVVNTCYDRSS